MTRRIAVLVNPTSGKGRGARLLLPVSDRLRAAGVDVEVVVGRDGDEAFDRLRDQVAEGVDGVAAVGGDGLVNIFSQADMDSRLAKAKENLPSKLKLAQGKGLK